MGLTWGCVGCAVFRCASLWGGGGATPRRTRHSTQNGNQKAPFNRRGLPQKMVLRQQLLSAEVTSYTGVVNDVGVGADDTASCFGGLTRERSDCSRPYTGVGCAGWVVRQERGGRAGHTCAVCTQVEVEVSTSYTEGGDAMELRPFVESSELVRSGAEVTSVCTSNCNESEQSNKDENDFSDTGHVEYSFRS